MAEEQEATVGYMGEFHLHDGDALYELHQVTGFQIPGPGSREQTESTHLKSPGWRRQYLSTFHEDSDFEVTLNSRLLSDTDQLLSSSLAAGDVRDFIAVIPENGEPVAQVAGTCKCIGYDQGEVTLGEPIAATATFRVVTITAAAPYVGGA